MRRFLVVLAWCVSLGAQSISITSPVNNSEVSGAISISATLTSLDNTARVCWYISDQLEQCVDAPPWGIPLFRTTRYADAVQPIKAVALDAAGNVLATAVNTFTTLNSGPKVTLALDQAQPLTGTANVTLAINDTGNLVYGFPQIICSEDGMPGTSQDEAVMSFGLQAGTSTSDHTIDFGVPHGLWTGQPFALMPDDGQPNNCPATVEAVSTCNDTDDFRFAIVVDMTKIRVASSYANAMAGTYLHFSNTGTETIARLVHSRFQWMAYEGSLYQPHKASTVIPLNTSRMANGDHYIYCVADLLNPDYVAKGGPSGDNSQRTYAAAGADIAVDPSNTFTKTWHMLITGEAVSFAGASGPTIVGGGSLDGNTYYAIRVDADHFKIATSPANAQAGTAVRLATAGTTTQYSFNIRHPGFIGFNHSAEAGLKITVNRTAVTPIALKPAYRYVHLTLDSSGQQTASLAPSLLNNDGSTSAVVATDCVYSSANTAIASVNASGVVSPVAKGYTYINVRYPGYYAKVWVRVDATLRFLHFGKAGVLSAYTPGSSKYPVAFFGMSAIDMSTIVRPYMQTYVDLVNRSDVNTSTQTLPALLSYTDLATCKDELERNYAYYWPNTLDGLTHLADVPSVLFIGDEWMVDPANVWRYVNQPVQKQCAQYFIGTLCARDQVCMENDGEDEVDKTQGPTPYQNETVGDSNPFTGIVVTGCPSACVGTVTNPQIKENVNALARVVQISAATSPSSLNGYYYVIDIPSVGVYRIKMEGISGITNTTYNASNNPGMKNHVYGAAWNRCQTWATPTVAISGTTGTVTWTAHGLTAGKWFGIAGSATDALNNYYQVATAATDTFTFTTKESVAGGTYSAGLTIFVPCQDPTPMTIQTIQDFNTQIFRYNDVIATSYPIVGGGIGDWNQPPFASSGSLYTTPLYRTFRARNGVWSMLNQMAYPSLDLTHSVDVPTLLLAHMTVGQINMVRPAGECDYIPGLDQVLNIGLGPQEAQAGLMFTAEANMSGARDYMSASRYAKRFFECMVGADHDEQVFAGPDVSAPLVQPLWNAISIALHTVNRLKAYILQPPLSSPYFGSYFMTGAKSGANGRILMATNFAEAPATATADLTPFRYTGGSMTRYTITTTGLKVEDVLANPTSDTVTFTPGGSVFWVFNSTPTRMTRDLNYPASLGGHPNAAKATIVGGPWGTDLDDPTKAVDCTSGCTITADAGMDWWVKMRLFDSGGRTVARGDAQKVPF